MLIAEKTKAGLRDGESLASFSLGARAHIPPLVAHSKEGRNAIRTPGIRKEKHFQLLLKIFTFAKALW